LRKTTIHCANCQRQAPTQILLDEAQDEIHAGRGAGRRVDGAIADEDRIGLDAHRGKALRQLVAEGPVRGRVAAVEQSGLGQHEGAGAQPHDAAGARRRPRQPADQLGIPARIVRSIDAGDDERIHRPAQRAVGALGHQSQSRPGIDRRNGRHDLHGIALGRRAGLDEAFVDSVEDVEHAADLDHFGARHREHHDAPESHRRLLLTGLRSLISSRRNGSNDNHTKNPASRQPSGRVA
jgi:hypothetical protein